MLADGEPAWLVAWRERDHQPLPIVYHNDVLRTLVAVRIHLKCVSPNGIC